MSTIAQPRRMERRKRSRRSSGAARTIRRPYITFNGATMVSIAAIVITVIGLLYLIQTSQVAQLGYEMSRLQTEREELALEISELQYEVARYESLYTVEQVAEEQLGMVPLSNYEFIEVQEPSQREISLPEELHRESFTLGERIYRAVMGIGSATTDSSGARDSLAR